MNEKKCKMYDANEDVFPLLFKQKQFLWIGRQLSQKKYTDINCHSGYLF